MKGAVADFGGNRDHQMHGTKGLRSQGQHIPLYILLGVIASKALHCTCRGGGVYREALMLDA